MSNPSTRGPGKSSLRQRLIAQLLLLPRTFFWLGFLCFAFGLLVTFIPHGNRGLFSVAAVLAAFGFLDSHWRVRIAALVLVTLSIFAAFDGHKRNVGWQLLERHHSTAAQHF